MTIPRPLALITGASSGIGAAFARRLAAAGYDLVLVARRRGRLEGMSEALGREHGARAEILAADLTGEADLARVEERIAAAGSLEVLVNNAGFGTRGRFAETDVVSQDRMHRLHVLAAVRLTHAALPGMIARRKGSVINVSSVAAFAPNPGNVSYCATKAWMNSFTEGLYLELRSAGSPVRVQALCPGYTVTEFHAAMGAGWDHVPAGWWMSAEDVVDASLRGLARGKLVVVPGLRYKSYAFVTRLLPRFLLHTLIVRFGRRFRADRGDGDGPGG
jgi:uncharacterized protein